MSNRHQGGGSQRLAELPELHLRAPLIAPYAEAAEPGKIGDVLESCANAAIRTASPLIPNLKVAYNMRTYASMRGSNPRDLARPATAAATEGMPITARGSHWETMLQKQRHMLSLID